MAPQWGRTGVRRNRSIDDRTVDLVAVRRHAAVAVVVVSILVALRGTAGLAECRCAPARHGGRSEPLAARVGVDVLEPVGTRWTLPSRWDSP